MGGRWGGTMRRRKKPQRRKGDLETIGASIVAFVERTTRPTKSQTVKEGQETRNAYQSQ